MTSPQVPQTTLNRIKHIETALIQTDTGPQSLLQCMSDYRIPGMSIAVINDYQLEWARGYGVREMGMSGLVDIETRFQACSISKPVAAIAALRLVEQGHLDLDTDINTYLTSWKLRSNGAWLPKVTLRQLLSHTAGISVPWFAGYHPAQDVPTLLEVLDSEQPSNAPPIRVTTLPGLRFRYSGGGYCVLQKLLTGIMKQSFPRLMHDLIFKPLCMQHSTYEQPQLSQKWDNAATGHRSSGKPIAGKWHIFPEMAVAGLWTTSSDLALLALSLQKAKAGEPNSILSTKMVDELLTPQSKGDDRGDMGLGVFVEGKGDTARFGHPGDNPGFSCLWISLMKGGSGCVAMTNSDNGGALLSDLFSTIAQIYAWPDIISRDEPLTVVTSADWISSTKQGEWTYDAYAALPDDGQRYEIIDGVLLLTPFAHSPQHQRIVGRISRYLSTYIEDTHLGEVFIGPLDVELTSNTVVQPDILIILNISSTKITLTHIEGIPDLAVEVSSPSTVGHDRSVKQKAYERAGVREYWFVDPLAHTIEILVLKGKTYTSLGVFSGELTLPSLVVPALEEVPAEKFFV